MTQLAIRHFIEQHPPLLALVTVQQADQILPIATSLQAGGITAIEITLRTAAGIDAIKLAKNRFPDLCICAGTVTAVEQIDKLADTGVNFLISPGTQPKLIEAAQSRQLSFLPGIMTPTDILQGMALGLTYYKFFPAGVMGGIKMLKALSGPFASLSFCPTGGINSGDFEQYLQLDNVFACGGSWLVTNDDIATENWQAIEAKARKTRQIMDSLANRSST